MTRGSEARWLRRQAPGTIGGRSEQATPAPSRPRAPISPVGGAESPRFATYVIAANDSTEQGKDGADFVCTGGPGSRIDHIVMQQAFDRIADAPAASGKIQFLEGNYYFGGYADAGDITGTVWLDGTGGSINDPGCRIHARDAGGDPTIPFKLYGACEISNLKIYAASVGLDMNSYGFDVHDCYFDDCRQAMVCHDAPFYDTFIWYVSKFHHNVLEGCGFAGLWTIDANFDSDGMFEWLIESNQQFDPAYAGAGFLRTLCGPDVKSDYMQFIDNTILDLVHLEGWRASTINGNIDAVFELLDLSYSTVANNTGFGDMRISDSEFLALTGNVVFGDLTLDTVDHIAATGNLVGGSFSETAVTNRRYAGNVGIADA